MTSVDWQILGTIAAAAAVWFLLEIRPWLARRRHRRQQLPGFPVLPKQKNAAPPW